MVRTGLDRLIQEPALQEILKGNIGYLCHSASTDSRLQHGAGVLKALAGDRLKALFAPQHGFATDAQDNMIESPHFFHPFYQVPVFSLYSETRVPTPEMLREIDCLVIDLQDNGTRVYTYIWTMVLAMEACAQAGIPVVVLDRPNPLGGLRIEGNMSSLAFQSIIGWYPFPMMHGMTIAEIARYAVQVWHIPVELHVIPMAGWRREMSFAQTGLPWVLPSPNFPTTDTAAVYPATVFIEATCLSEGRGTTRPFELIGHPALPAYTFSQYFADILASKQLHTAVLRPATFSPTFDKFSGQSCQGFQVHIVDSPHFRPWQFGQLLLQALYHFPDFPFSWRQPPFEYIYDKLPIDLLQGSDLPRQWITQKGSLSDLSQLEMEGRDDFMKNRTGALLY